MYKFIKPSKDASIYKGAVESNTGLDPILEVSKFISGSINSGSIGSGSVLINDFEIIRSLIQFNLDSVANESVETSHLILRVDRADEIPLDYTLYVYPISGSWDMGTSRSKYDSPSNGVTWKYRDFNSLTIWATGSLTGSVYSTYEDGLGGVWYSTPLSTQSFSYQTGDTEMDVFDIVRDWLSGSIQNNGFILKHSNSADSDSKDYGNIKFFSKETHTIYKPKLRIGINDFIYSTGSLHNLNSVDELKVTPKLKTNYKKNTKVRIEIVGRELYPKNTYDKVQQFKQKALPQTSYYEIRDYLTDTIIIPFSQYSRISCNTTNINYIDLDFTDWESNRDYIISFKVDRNGSTEYYYDNFKFRLID